MSDRRDDDTPTDPLTASRYAKLAKDARDRSTQTTRIADLAALEIARLHGLPDEAAKSIAVIVRGYIGRAVDASQLALSGELVKVKADRDRLKTQLQMELRRRSEER